jgi:hypothetical protein
MNLNFAHIINHLENNTPTTQASDPSPSFGHKDSFNDLSFKTKKFELSPNEKYSNIEQLREEQQGLLILNGIAYGLSKL